MFSIKSLTLGAVCALACTATAQHTVTITGNWVSNLTIFTVPQNNTDTDGTFPDFATANARGNYFRVRVTGSSNMTIAAMRAASTSANGGAQGSYTYVGAMNGAVIAFGDTQTSGSATTTGSTPGSQFDCAASYSNSLGQSANAGSNWTAGSPPVMTVPSSFGNPMAIFVALSYSWSSSNDCSISVSARGAGASTNVSGLARINSTVTLL